VVGSLNRRYFRVAESAILPNIILTEEGRDIPFLGLRRVATTAEGRPVYRVLSAAPPNEKLLGKLFKDRTQTATRRWDAYPVLRPPLGHLLPFRLSAGLYYVNSLEWAVSTMETEVIASRNVVNLLSNDLRVAKD
jgi:prenylcysteine oxidase / farnesylcysteine lyase